MTATLAKRQSDLDSLASGSRNHPSSNDGPTILAFVARGIPVAEIETFGAGQNVRTYKAWRALDRQVRKGEQSVRLTVWRPIGQFTTDPDTGEKKAPRCRPVSACVFHVSQTDALEVGTA